MYHVYQVLTCIMFIKLSTDMYHVYQMPTMYHVYQMPTMYHVYQVLI